MSSTTPTERKRPRFRWSLRALMILVGLAAVGLFTVEQIRQRQPLNRLIRALRTGDVVARKQAASQLGALGPQAEPAVPALIAATLDADPRVRLLAIHSLTRIVKRDRKRLEPCLLARLDDSQENVRIQALNALDDPDFRNQTVVAALVRRTLIGPPFQEPNSGILGGMLLSPDQLLAKWRPPPSWLVPPIEAAWKSSTFDTRKTIGSIVSNYGGPQDALSPELARVAILLIEDADTRVRRFGIPLGQNLGWIVRADAAKSLASRLEHDLKVAPRSQYELDTLVDATYLGWDLLSVAPDGRQAIPILSEAIRSSDDRIRLVASVLTLWIGPSAESLAPEIADSMVRPYEDRFSLAIFASEYTNRLKYRGALNPDLSARFPDTTWLVRSSVDAGGQILSNLGPGATKPAVSVLKARLRESHSPDQIKLLAKALGTIGPGAEETAGDLVDQLTAHPGHERLDPFDPESMGVTLATALGNIGVGGDRALVLRLAALLDDQSDWTRFYAATVLRDLGPQAQAAFPALIEALQGPDENVRQRVAQTLSKLGLPPEQVVPPLKALLDDDDGTVRGNAAFGLAEIGPPARSSLPSIERMLRNLNVSARVGAANAFWRFGRVAEPVIPSLLTALKDENAQVRMSARNAMETVSPPIGYHRPRAPRSQDRTGTPIVDRSCSEALEAARSPDFLQRRAAAVDLALAQEKDDRAAVEALQTLVHDEAPSVRATASAALGFLGGSARSASVDLIETTHDPDPQVRISALRAIAFVEPESEETRSAEIAALDDPEEQVRLSAITALGSMGPRASPVVPRLVELLDGANRVTRFFVYYHLGSIGPAGGAALPPLEDALHDPDSAFRYEAAHALARMAENGHAEAVLPILVNALQDDASDVFWEAARGIGIAQPRPFAEQTALDLLELGSPLQKRAADYALRQIPR